MKVDLYSNRSIDSVPTMAINVFGGELGFTGRVGSLTLPSLSSVKFLIATMNDNLVGISPGRFAEPGASPIIVKIASISSLCNVPDGNPLIQALESVILPNGKSPSGTSDLSSK